MKITIEVDEQGLGIEIETPDRDTEEFIIEKTGDDDPAKRGSSKVYRHCPTPSPCS